MNVRYILNQLKRKLHSRIRTYELVNRVYLLEFENEAILKFLTKYNILTSSKEQTEKMHTRTKIQDYVSINNEPRIIVNVIEP
ncbi:MAG: hypothetical protein ACXABO_16265 [Promethearchaeota archaeon]|jgi:hypothetical protein